MKICYKCKQKKPLTEFRQFKSGVNKGYYSSYCKKCQKEYQNLPWIKIQREKYRKKNPWAKTQIRILTRCNGKNQDYHKRGIKNFLIGKDLKFLWFRDKAYLMKRPSIHRIDNSNDYFLENCKYIELGENVRLSNIERGKKCLKV